MSSNRLPEVYWEFLLKDQISQAVGGSTTGGKFYRLPPIFETFSYQRISSDGKAFLFEVKHLLNGKTLKTEIVALSPFQVLDRYYHSVEFAESSPKRL